MIILNRLAGSSDLLKEKGIVAFHFKFFSSNNEPGLFVASAFFYNLIRSPSHANTL